MVETQRNNEGQENSLGHEDKKVAARYAVIRGLPVRDTAIIGGEDGVKGVLKAWANHVPEPGGRVGSNDANLELDVGGAVGINRLDALVEVGRSVDVVAGYDRLLGGDTDKKDIARQLGINAKRPNRSLERKKEALEAYMSDPDGVSPQKLRQFGGKKGVEALVGAISRYREDRNGFVEEMRQEYNDKSEGYKLGDADKKIIVEGLGSEEDGGDLGIEFNEKGEILNPDYVEPEIEDSNELGEHKLKANKGEDIIKGLGFKKSEQSGSPVEPEADAVGVEDPDEPVMPEVTPVADGPVGVDEEDEPVAVEPEAEPVVIEPEVDEPEVTPEVEPVVIEQEDLEEGEDKKDEKERGPVGRFWDKLKGWLDKGKSQERREIEDAKKIDGAEGILSRRRAERERDESEGRKKRMLESVEKTVAGFNEDLLMLDEAMRRKSEGMRAWEGSLEHLGIRGELNERTYLLKRNELLDGVANPEKVREKRGLLDRVRGLFRRK